MTIKQLQYIVALDTHRHFVRAAESCFVSQPTLTLQVKKLEEQVGLIIFDRSSQPLTPTPMGSKFIARARRILREIEQLKELVNHDRNLIEGTFKVGIIPSLSQYLLPLFLEVFTEAHPKAKLIIKELHSATIIKSLKNNTLHIGIMATPTKESQLREIPLYYEPFLVYAHPKSPLLQHQRIAANDLKAEGLWLLDSAHCFRNQTLNICQKAADLPKDKSISFENVSIGTLKKLIRNMYGYTLIPELAYDAHTDQELVRRFSEPEPAREISLVVHNSFTKERLLTSLQQAITQNVPQNFRKNHRFTTIEWR